MKRQIASKGLASFAFGDPVKVGMVTRNNQVDFVLRKSTYGTLTCGPRPAKESAKIKRDLKMCKMYALCYLDAQNRCNLRVFQYTDFKTKDGKKGIWCGETYQKTVLKKVGQGAKDKIWVEDNEKVSFVVATSFPFSVRKTSPQQCTTPILSACIASWR